MFWVMMYMVFFTSSVVPELSFTPTEQAVVDTVNDEQRLTTIMSVREEMSSQEETLISFMKQQYSELAGLSRDHAASEESFRAIFENMDQKRNKIKNAMIQNRFRLKAQMTRKEWEAVFKKTNTPKG